jgi:hypothetical protein
MSARELDRFRRAQERFESQQEAEVTERAQERREREERDESVFDRELREAADRQAPPEDDDDDDRDVRPGRGTEDRVVEREPSPEPEPQPQPEPVEAPERPPRAQPEPGPEPIEVPDVDVREVLEEASEAIRGEFQEAPPDIANIGEVIATGAEPEFIEPGGFRTGAVQGAGTIADVPGTALGLEAAGRFGAARLGEVAAGEPGQAFETTAEAADRAVSEAVRAFEEDPVRVGTQLGASLALSAGAFGAASAIGPRAGTAARFAIQPGEELLGRGGFAATRAVRGEPTAQRFFPNQEPLIFSEEAALRAARRFRGADVNVRGVGAGIPALELELEQEPEIGREAIETETLLVEAERLRGEVEEELMIETEPFIESELELRTRLRTELDFFQEVEAEGIGVEVTEPAVEVTPIETELPAEGELLGETVAEGEVVTELLAEAEQEGEQELELAREIALEPRREVEPLGIELPIAAADIEPIAVSFRGVRTVEAELRPTELDLD